MINFIGWLSTFCFTIAGFPQVLKTIKEGHARGISTGFLFFWFMGNVTGAIYAVSSGSFPLAIGFITTVLFGSIIWKYKLFN